MTGHATSAGDRLPDTLLGLKLHGEGLSDAEIAEWFADEESGYYDLVEGHYFGGDDSYRYEYSALNEFHAFRHLRGEHFGTCLALGCARGDDVAELAPMVDRYVCIEPARQWWTDNIRGKPAEFRTPTLRGTVDLPDESIDLAVSLGVLHHIPNVSEVIAEIARLLRPGGIFVLREPITSMGDFRRPRAGLTRNERGIPHDMLVSWLRANGLRIERSSFCMVSAIRILAEKAGFTPDFNSPWYTRLDAFGSAVLAPNVAYWRGSTIKKIAPSSVFIIARKTADRNEGERGSAR